MGGAIGTLFLEKYPEVFERAVLSSPMLQVNFGKNPTWLVKVLMALSKILRWDLKYVPGQKGFDHVYVSQPAVRLRNRAMPIFSTSVSKCRNIRVMAVPMPDQGIHQGDQADRTGCRKGTDPGITLPGRQGHHGKSGRTGVFRKK